MENFILEPQPAICCDHSAETLNLVSAPNQGLARTSCEILSAPPAELIREIESINKHARSFTNA